MPTEPLPAFYDPDRAKVLAQPLIDHVCPLLREIINYSGRAMARCVASSSGRDDYDVAAFVLIRQMMESADGVEILLRAAAPAPAVPLVRTMFEAMLALEYILESDDTYDSRSLAWLVGYAKQRLNSYERLDPSTRLGTEFLKTKQTDKMSSRLSNPPLEEVREAINRLRTLLDKPHLRPIADMWNKNKPRSWHHLGAGPRSVEALAQHLGRGVMYDILYRQWSSVAHAQDLLGFIATTTDGNAGIAGLRRGEKFGEVSNFACSFLLEGVRILLGKFRPEEKLAPWYLGDVRQRYRTMPRAG